LLSPAFLQVPEHCFWDTVGEFIASPEVAYTQHYTAPFTEQNRNYWEQYISHFTRLIYLEGIAGSVANGDIAPLVGHNAFLRWSAVRKVAFTDDFCGPKEVRYWSENSVSEDFDMCLRLANQNLFGRYVMYTGDDFQEGRLSRHVAKIRNLHTP
jgi:cellulose synthase/poly-beta-1,6-N-acetylglucosamine synthase-like glycosyltransferase